MAAARIQPDHRHGRSSSAERQIIVCNSIFFDHTRRVIGSIKKDFLKLSGNI